MVGEIISEWWATSNRNGGRDHSGMVGDIERNQHPIATDFCGATRNRKVRIADMPPTEFTILTGCTSIIRCGSRFR
jgi:hypothetical protein